MKVKERLVNLSELVWPLRRFFLLILASALLFGVIGYAYSSLRTTVTYAAVSGAYVQAADVDMEAGSTSSQITLARAHASECRDAIKAEAVYDNIRQYFADRRVDEPDAGWEDLSVYDTPTLRAMLSCVVETSSQYVEIHAIAPTPSLAVHMANAAAGVLEASVVDIISNCRIMPTTVARSATPQSDFSYRDTLIATAIGGGVMYAGLFLYTYFDPRLRHTAELKEAYGDAILLGTIPAQIPYKGGKRG